MTSSEDYDKIIGTSTTKECLVYRTTNIYDTQTNLADTCHNFLLLDEDDEVIEDEAKENDDKRFGLYKSSLTIHEALEWLNKNHLTIDEETEKFLNELKDEEDEETEYQNTIQTRQNILDTLFHALSINADQDEDGNWNITTDNQDLPDYLMNQETSNKIGEYMLKNGYAAYPFGCEDDPDFEVGSEKNFEKFRKMC